MISDLQNLDDHLVPILYKDQEDDEVCIIYESFTLPNILRIGGGQMVSEESCRCQKGIFFLKFNTIECKNAGSAQQAI